MSQEKAALNMAMSIYDRSMDTIDAMLDLIKALLERSDLDKDEKGFLKSVTEYLETGQGEILQFSADFRSAELMAGAQKLTEELKLMKKVPKGTELTPNEIFKIFAKENNLPYFTRRDPKRHKDIILIRDCDILKFYDIEEKLAEHGMPLVSNPQLSYAEFFEKYDHGADTVGFIKITQADLDKINASKGILSDVGVEFALEKGSARTVNLYLPMEEPMLEKFKALSPEWFPVEKLSSISLADHRTSMEEIKEEVEKKKARESAEREKDKWKAK